MSRIIRDITEIASCCAQFRADAMAPLGLKACHASYLVEICAHPGISQDQLARRVCINKSNIARQVAVLEEDGYLLRTPSPSDKRIMELYPTPRTLELLPQIETPLAALEQALTEGLPDEDFVLLQRILARMRGKAADWMENR